MPQLRSPVRSSISTTVLRQARGRRSRLALVIGALAQCAIAEAKATPAEVAAMPAGTHAILDQTREAVERRARALLAQLQEPGEDSAVEIVNATREP